MFMKLTHTIPCKKRYFICINEGISSPAIILSIKSDFLSSDISSIKIHEYTFKFVE